MDELTQEQIAELRQKAELADSISKEKEALAAKLKEYEEDTEKVDWRKARQTIKSLKSVAEKQGLTVDEDTGEVKEAPREVSRDEIESIASQVAEKKFIEKSIASVKKTLNEEDRKTFDRFYTKAIAGETVTGDNVDEFIDIAMKMAGRPAVRGTVSPRGNPPVLGDGESFENTERGRELINRFSEYKLK